MRILQVAHQFLPRHRAGVEVHTDRVARALQGRGDEVAVVTTEELPARNGTVVATGDSVLRVFRIAQDRTVADPLDTLGTEAGEAAFQGILDRFQPAIVHFHHLMYVGLRTPSLARAAGAKTLMTLHDYWLLCARGGQLRQEDGTLCESAQVPICAGCLGSFRFGRTRFEGQVGRFCAALRQFSGFDLFPVAKRLALLLGPPKPGPSADCGKEASGRMMAFLEARAEAVGAATAAIDRFHAPSRFLMKKFQDAGFPNDRLFLEPYGIPCAAAGPPSRRAAGERLPLQVGFIGSIVPQKGLHVLLQALARLPKSEFRLRVIGSARQNAAYAASCHALARNLDVRFEGVLEGESLARARASLDCLVVPSLWFENAPLVISEAHAAGVPVVTSRLGGMAELVADGIDGLHFEPGDPQDLARVLGQLGAAAAPLEKLRRGISPPRTLDDEINGLRAVYAELLGASP